MLTLFLSWEIPFNCLPNKILLQHFNCFQFHSQCLIALFTLFYHRYYSKCEKPIAQRWTKECKFHSTQQAKNISNQTFVLNPDYLKLAAETPCDYSANPFVALASMSSSGGWHDAPMVHLVSCSSASTWSVQSSETEVPAVGQGCRLGIWSWLEF